MTQIRLYQNASLSSPLDADIIFTAQSNSIPLWIESKTSMAELATYLTNKLNINAINGAPLTLARGGTSAAITPTANNLVYSTASALALLATANNSVLITDSGGTPSLSSTLPSGITLVAPNLGIPASGTLTNCSGLPLTTGVTGLLPLTNGGTNANLTPSNGGIVFSNVSQFQILAGTSTARQILMSGASTTPSWSTATYPSSTTINQLLYSSSANTIAGLSSVNSAVLATSSTGVPTWLGSLTNGQIIIGSTGAIPVASTLTAGSGVSIANAAGSITISATGTGGTVTSISQGTGLTFSSNPLTTTGTISLTVPVGVTNGGTGLTSTTINQLLYSSSNNVIAGLVTGNNGVLITSSGGAPSISSTLPSAVQSNITLTESQVTNLVSDLSSKLNLSGGTMTGNLILNADPTVALGAVTKQYADAISAGLDIKQACFAGSTASLTATYSNGTSGVGATLTNSGTQAVFSIDSTTPSVNSRILIKDQSTTFQNGIYVVTNVGSVSTNWVLTRSTDYDSTSEIQPGNLIVVDNGSTNAGTGWLQTATVTTIGTSAILFSPFNLMQAGTGLTRTGNTISLTVPVAVTNGGTGLTTTTINQILYSSNANTISGISVVNNSALLTNGSGVPNWVAYTGSGSPVLATSPTLVTPLLGIPTSGTLTNCTGLPLTSGVTGILPILNGGSGTSTPSLVAGSGIAITGSWPNQTITANGGNLVAGTNIGISGNTISVINNPTFSGLVTASSGLTVTGTITLNTSGSSGISIGTGTYTGTITIGNNSSITAFAGTISGSPTWSNTQTFPAVISSSSNMGTLSASSLSVSGTGLSGIAVFKNTTANAGTFLEFINSSSSTPSTYIGTDGTSFVGIQNGALTLTTDSTNNLPIYLSPGFSTTWGLKVATGSVVTTHNNTLDDGSGNILIKGNFTSTLNQTGAYTSIISRASRTGLTPVQSGDNLGVINGQGYDGSAYQNSTYIFSRVDGTVSSGIVPARLDFYTANSSGTSNLNFSIRANGAITTPNNTLDDGSGNTITIGQSTLLTPTGSTTGGMLVSYSNTFSTNLLFCNLSETAGASLSFYGSWMGMGLGYSKTTFNSEPTNPWTIYSDGSAYGFAGMIASWGGLQFFHQPKVNSVTNGIYNSNQMLAQEVMRITSIGVKTFKGCYFNTISNPAISAGNQTITAAQLLNMVASGPAQSGAFTWTTDTGTNIYNAIGSPAVGTSFWVKFSNTSNSFAMTVAFGSGVSGNLDGNTIAADSEKTLIFRCTGTNTFTVY